MWKEIQNTPKIPPDIGLYTIRVDRSMNGDLNHLQRTCRFVILNKCILKARSASLANSLYLSSCRDIYFSHKSHMTLPLAQEFVILSQSATFAFKNPCVPFCYFYRRKLIEQHVEKGVEKSTLKIIVVFFG